MMLRKLPAIIAALLAPALMAAPAQAGSFSAIYAFGDSLSDVGNVFAATGGAKPAPPYKDGQASNGPVWVQDLSGFARLGTLRPSSLGGNDWAWGGATTGVTPSPVPDGTQQVGAFLLAHGSAPASGLYTMTLGANDVSNILTELQTGTISRPNALAEAQAAAEEEADAIELLAAAGAHTFIVALVPDLGLTPLVRDQGPAAQSAATGLSAFYDSQLVADLGPLAGSLSGGLHFLDTFSWVQSVVADPGAFGFTNATDACYAGPLTGGEPPPVCGSPDSYLFWDSFHPSARAHELIAEAAWAFVPSPSPGVGLASLGLLLLIGLKRKRA